jgi:predicted membrane GTPase involved in stress response
MSLAYFNPLPTMPLMALINRPWSLSLRSLIEGRDRGVMVSMEAGVSTAYALNNIQERGRLFIGPQEDVYTGMIVGENARYRLAVADLVFH